jgi:putative transposase
VLLMAGWSVQTAAVLISLLYRLLLGLLGLLVRLGGERELEILVLRDQLAILRRGGKRPLYTTSDRALLAAASRLLSPEPGACFLLRPQTLRRWHQALLLGKRPEPRKGRPPLAIETSRLIERLARENPRSGSMRIQG